MNVHLLNLENILTVLSASQFYRNGSTERSSHQPKATQQMADIESVPRQQVSGPNTWQMPEGEGSGGNIELPGSQVDSSDTAFGDLTFPAAETDFLPSIG